MCFRNHFTNILNFPFENDFYTSIFQQYIKMMHQNEMVLMFVQNFLNEQD